MISREEAGFYQEDDYLNYSLNDEEEAAYTQWQNSWNQPYPQSPVYEPWSPHSSYTYVTTASLQCISVFTINLQKFIFQFYDRFCFQGQI